MAQETEEEHVLELESDRERYVPDWIVEEVVRFALQTDLREPILQAVSDADADETAEVEIDVEPEEPTTGDDASDDVDDGSGGRLRRVGGLLVLAIGAFVAYRVLAGGRE